MKLFMYALVALSGALNAAQSGSNAELGRSLGRPWLVGLIISLATASVFAVGAVASGQGVPTGAKLAATPWWAWLGGFCGATYIVATLFYAGTLGSGLFTGLTITTGVIVSILLDHFGLLGFKQHAAGLWRIVGTALMIGGLGLVARF